ncbi:MAG: nickel-type superoxide dismutase maturation protease [Chloroflexaceae bacterium]|nr:nickel-type superoxide dismutase maturation protease [Chloroflexaceae bacterium]
MSASLPASNYRELFLWLLGRRRRFRVTGPSMLPLLRPGEEVLVQAIAKDSQGPQAGEIVIARHPDQPGLRLIKRVKAVDGGLYFLQGDNDRESTDSRSFGAVPWEQILGKVTSRFP